MLFLFVINEINYILAEVQAFCLNSVKTFKYF